MLGSRVTIVALDVGGAEDLDLKKKNIEERKKINNNYLLLSTEEKIKKIEERIRYICNELKAKEPDAMWLITWREYGITAGTDITISPQDKAFFKQRMQKLVKEFSPNLGIVAGTVSTKRHYNDLSKLDRIEEYYKKHRWINDAEAARKNPEERQLEMEEKIIQDLKQKQANTEIDVIRNTCYVFYGDEIWRHDKITPFKEVKDDFIREQTVYQPGNKKNNNPYITLIHPVTKEPIIIGVEICREHLFATFKKGSVNKSKFHFIMSASIPLDLDNIHGEYVLHLDSRFKPKLLTTKNENSTQSPIRFYQSSLQKEEHHLSWPLQPLYPFEKHILDKLNELIKQMSSDKKEALIEYRELFTKLSSNQAMHDDLKDMLNAIESAFGDETVKQSTLFHANFSLKKWLQEVRDIMQQDFNKELTCKDYLSKEEAKPLYLIDLFNYALCEKNYYEAFNCIRRDNSLLQQRTLNITEFIGLFGEIMMSVDSNDEKEKFCKMLFEYNRPVIMEPVAEQEDQTLLHGLCAEKIDFMIYAILPYCQGKTNQGDKNGDTALHVAIKKHVDLKIIQVLLEHGANWDCQNNKNVTPLNLAETSYPEAVLLINNFKKTRSLRL